MSKQNKMYGALLFQDVFVYDGVAYQKMENGTAYQPETRKVHCFNKTTVIEFVGWGIWPSGKRPYLCTDGKGGG